MATARGAGTEILRSAWHKEVDSTNTNLIIGVQHHIYTVLSFTIFCHALGSGDNTFNVYLQGYDAKAGTTNENIKIASLAPPLAATGFVWNDKFSFNGFEGANFSGPLDDATKQDAIADQDSAVPQILFTNTAHGSDNYDVSIAYLDQNHA